MSMDEIVVRDRHIEVLEARIAELEEALIEERAQYLRTLDDNPGCSAWDFDDLTTRREEYKNDARDQLHSEGKI